MRLHLRRSCRLPGVVRFVFPVAYSRCEGVRVVIGDEAPLGGVAQVILHGVRVVGQSAGQGT